MILDTNALSAMADHDPALLRLLKETDVLVLSFISLSEFHYGLLGSTRPESGLYLLARLEAALPVFYPDADTIRHYAWIADHLKRKGRMIPHNDIWTAALARQHAMAIISKDQHFDSIDEIRRISW